MSKVIVIGDALVSSDTLADAAMELDIGQPIEIKKYEWNADLSWQEFQQVIKEIETKGPEIFDIPDGIMIDLADADYLLVHLAPVTKKMVEGAKQLKLIGTCRGGLEHINLKACKQEKIPVIHVFRNAEPVADFTIGLMISETRNIARGHHYVKSGKWVKNYPNDPYRTNMRNLKVGIFGLGHIGKLVVERLNALRIETIAYDPYVDIDQIHRRGLKVQMVDNLQTLFSESDIVSLHARVTPETRNIINKNLLSLMKPGSYLINTARPELICKPDLIDVLKNHRIAGAALDVFWEEPIDINDELLKLDNVTLTPHIAGDTVDALPKSPYLLRDAMNDYFKNEQSDLLVI